MVLVFNDLRVSNHILRNSSTYYYVFDFTKQYSKEPKAAMFSPFYIASQINNSKEGTKQKERSGNRRLEGVQTLVSCMLHYSSPHFFIKFCIRKISVDCWMIIVYQFHSRPYYGIGWWIAVACNRYTLSLTIQKNLVVQTLVTVITNYLIKKKKKMFSFILINK